MFCRSLNSDAAGDSDRSPSLLCLPYWETGRVWDLSPALGEL